MCLVVLRATLHRITVRDRSKFLLFDLNPQMVWRVYYEVSDEPQRTVTVLAIGVKERDRVRIGGEIIRL